MDAPSGFDALLKEVKPPLARAFVAAFGPARGGDALAAALGYAWEHYEVVTSMDNPAGYLYRVGAEPHTVSPAPAVLPCARLDRSTGHRAGAGRRAARSQ